MARGLQDVCWMIFVIKGSGRLDGFYMDKVWFFSDMDLLVFSRIWSDVAIYVVQLGLDCLSLVS
jgi:hypothetical protein